MENIFVFLQSYHIILEIQKYFQFMTCIRIRVSNKLRYSKSVLESVCYLVLFIFNKLQKKHLFYN